MTIVVPVSDVVGWDAHAEAVARLRASYDAIPPGAPVRLAKRTSNLFRARSRRRRPRPRRLRAGRRGRGRRRPDGSATADVQGMCTYEDLVDVTLARGFIPYVVPQLRSITLGGAVTGLGIESTSFRNGLPHESVLEMDVLTGAGEVVTDHARASDLFDAFPNSYGSLGYATRLRIRLERVPAYVDLRHLRFDDLDVLAKTIERDRRATASTTASGSTASTAWSFEPGEAYLTLATWTDEAAGDADHRLHRHGPLLPLAPAARDRHADDVRLPLALGHRLVLVLGRVRPAEPPDPPALAAALAAQ